MYQKTKYVIGGIAGAGGVRFPEAVVFSDMINHSEMRRLFMDDSIEAAGFCYINDEGKITVYGASSSLGGIKSRPGVDERFIERALGLNRQDY